MGDVSGGARKAGRQTGASRPGGRKKVSEEGFWSLQCGNIHIFAHLSRPRFTSPASKIMSSSASDAEDTLLEDPDSDFELDVDDYRRGWLNAFHHACGQAREERELAPQHVLDELEELRGNRYVAVRCLKLHAYALVQLDDGVGVPVLREHAQSAHETQQQQQQEQDDEWVRRPFLSVEYVEVRPGCKRCGNFRAFIELLARVAAQLNHVLVIERVHSTRLTQILQRNKHAWHACKGDSRSYYYHCFGQTEQNSPLKPPLSATSVNSVS